MKGKPRKEKTMTLTTRQLYHEAHKEQFEQFAEYTNPELRKMLFEMLGDVCNDCGETDPQVLTLEHSLGSGTREREKIGARGILIKALVQKGVNYEILCANCQLRRVRRKV
jgi:hypothetical protein